MPLYPAMFDLFGKHFLDSTNKHRVCTILARYMKCIEYYVC